MPTPSFTLNDRNACDEQLLKKNKKIWFQLIGVMV